MPKSRKPIFAENRGTAGNDTAGQSAPRSPFARKKGKNGRFQPVVVGAGQHSLDSAAKKKSGNKFGAKKTECHHGHKHDSRKEAARCNDLHMLQRAGHIRNLKVHPQYWFIIDGKQVKHENGRRLGYNADFSYDEASGQGTAEAGQRNAHKISDIDPLQTIVEDVKGGYRDDAWTVRKAVFRALYPDLILREMK